MNVLSAYENTRTRVAAVAATLGPDDETRVVPACPDWSVHDLLAHVAGLPTELAAGRYPTGDLDAWIQEVVGERRDVPTAQLLAEWDACGDALEPVLGGGLLLVDVLVHEHDLRGALGVPGARDAAEIEFALPFMFDALAEQLRNAPAGSIAVRDADTTWQSDDREPGWTLLVSPWEATRALASRRTAEELRALPAEGDVEPYLSVLDAHLPLPKVSLRE